MPDPNVEEFARRTEAVNFLFGGWIKAVRGEDPSTTDPRIDSIRRLLPTIDRLDDSPTNAAAVQAGLSALPLDKLTAEVNRRNRGHAAGTSAYVDPANRQTGRREDITTTDVARGAGEALGATASGILSGLWAFVKPLLPYAGIAVAGYLIVTNLPKKGSADWRNNR